MRVLEVSAVTILIINAVKDDDDSFIGKLRDKSLEEALSLISVLDPEFILKTPRVIKYLDDLGSALGSVVRLEEYKTKEGYKGINQFKRLHTPGMIKQFQKIDSGEKTSGIKLKINQKKIKPLKLKIKPQQFKIKKLKLKN